MVKESHKKSIVKSITWRICATSTTMGLVFFLSKDTALALSLGVLETVVKLMVYYGHERAWNKINWNNSSKKQLIKRKIAIETEEKELQIGRNIAGLLKYPYLESQKIK